MKFIRPSGDGQKVRARCGGWKIDREEGGGEMETKERRSISNSSNFFPFPFCSRDAAKGLDGCAACPLHRLRSIDHTFRYTNLFIQTPKS